MRKISDSGNSSWIERVSISPKTRAIFDGALFGADSMAVSSNNQGKVCMKTSYTIWYSPIDGTIYHIGQSYDANDPARTIRVIGDEVGPRPALVGKLKTSDKSVKNVLGQILEYRLQLLREEKERGEK